ncbi:hypothetical protein [Massilia sp. X63]|uniref:hypothetical protein n=1 Tax=Massilia sp. X63 TaxID=3237285 RepID=UPI0034DDC483
MLLASSQSPLRPAASISRVSSLPDQDEVQVTPWSVREPAWAERATPAVSARAAVALQSKVFNSISSMALNDRAFASANGPDLRADGHANPDYSARKDLSVRRLTSG